MSAVDILVADGRITAARFGSFQVGWSRIEIGMLVDRITGQAVLRIAPGPVTEEEFAANGISPPSSNWAPEQACTPVLEKIDEEFIGRIDPGHDGIDLGAVRDGANEKDLMLTLRWGVAEALVRSGEGCDGLHAVG